jgi:hypothetical protein
MHYKSQYNIPYIIRSKRRTAFEWTAAQVEIRWRYVKQYDLWTHPTLPISIAGHTVRTAPNDVARKCEL